eukprot:TRINITY_DN5844_c0_g1_i1.p1 TRINITY_DN5844_c0_g1~~TRINITY_DN5844_c0_g1_i1.p1  ORF type:complete len:172 (+),score=64.99 TRINITY_DN5844_c0_g1_i1:32-517(+)
MMAYHASLEDSNFTSTDLERSSSESSLTASTTVLPSCPASLLHDSDVDTDPDTYYTSGDDSISQIHAEATFLSPSPSPSSSSSSSSSVLLFSPSDDASLSAVTTATSLSSPTPSQQEAGGDGAVEERPQHATKSTSMRRSRFSFLPLFLPFQSEKHRNRHP